LRENVKFAPTAGKYKVYIIDEVHMLTTEAFNALLKTLEEPPEFVKFIFATTQPHKVIPTILSRCQRFDFRRISLMEITAQLERIVSQEGIDIDKDVLYAIAKSSDGSLRDAESVLDQLSSFAREKISLKDVISVLGLVQQDALFDVTDKIIQKDPKGALELLNNIIDEGKDISVFLANLIEHFRNLMIAKVTRGDSKLIDLPQDICERLLQQSDALSLEEIFSAFNILVSTQEMSKRLDSVRIPLEISLIRLAHEKRPAAHSSPAQKYSQESKNPQAKEKVPQEEAKNDDALKGKDEHPIQQVSLDNIKGAWQDFINNLAKIKMSVATYLNEGQPLKIQGSTLTIAFPKNYSLHKESLERRENRTIIEKSISELMNANIKVNFVLSSQDKQKEDSEDHPFIKSAIEMFGGRIIKKE
jgi:DNA polymerase-3 subunit gamma/tau